MNTEYVIFQIKVLYLKLAVWNKTIFRAGRGIGKSPA